MSKNVKAIASQPALTPRRLDLARFTQEAAYVGVFRSLYDDSPKGYRIEEG